MTQGPAQIIAALAALAFVTTGCAGGSAAPTRPVAASPSASPSPTPTGLLLRPIAEIRHGPNFAPSYVATKNGCRGAQGLDELRKGAGVTLYSANGDVVGTGFVTDTFVLARKCYLVAKVPDVIPAAFYQVQFVNRNKLAFSRKQLESKTAVTIFG